MRRGLILNILATVILGMTSAIAQDNGTGFVGNGYYRIRNYVTERYIYFTDNRDYYDPTHDKEDFQAVQLWIGAEKAAASPASVVYINNVSGNNYDLTAQGTSIYSLMGYYVNFYKNADGTYEASASAAGVTKYLSDNDLSDSSQGRMGSGGASTTRRWIIDKIETNHSTNYIGIKPTLQVGDKHYQPFYVAFPFKTASPNMHVFYVSQILGTKAVLKEIVGDVPASTPVIIECASENPTDNRIEPLTSSEVTVSDNLLDGTFFCNGSRPRESVDAYRIFDATVMRVFTEKDGKLVVTNDDRNRLMETRVFNPDNPVSTTKVKRDCIPANTSYLIVDANTPAELDIFFERTMTEEVAEIDGIFYILNIDEKVAKVTYPSNGDKYEGKIVIPSSITYFGETYSVTNIGKKAFYGCTGLTSITIPNSVTSIGSNAFDGCSCLTSITIGNSVTSIGCDAFKGTPWFNNQPDGLVYVGKVAYKYKGTMAAGTQITIQEGTLEIADYAFDGYTGLTSIIIPNSVTNIGNGAFRGCGMTSIIIPDGVTNIGGQAFYCSALTSISIPNSVTSIGDYAFYGCGNLTSVIIENGLKSIGFGSFIDCQSLKSIIIPQSVTSIGTQAFFCCSGLTSVTIENGVKIIESDAFAECCGLTSIIIPESVESIFGSTFYHCSNLSSIKVEEENIKYDSREDCNAIIETATNTLVVGCNNTIIPNSVTGIGGRAFDGCSALKSVTIPDNLTSIGEMAFSGCSSLTSINLPDGMTDIGNSAFFGCSSLPSVIIPNGIKHIDYDTFNGCSNLTSIAIPSSVTSILGSAFGYCNSLTDVYCYAEELPFTDSYLFDGSNIQNATLHVPETSLDAYSSNEPWSNFGSIVAIPSFTLTYMVDGEIYKTVQYEEGESITPEEAPTKEGYSFSGWESLPETMPAEDVTVTGSFTINQYLLTYMIDGEEYKSYELDYNTALTPEPAPIKKGMTFSGWGDVPETMPAHDVTLTGSYTWSKEVVDGVVYQVADTLSNYASVVGYEGTGEEVTILSDVLIGEDVYAVNNIAENALPKTTTIYVSVGRLLLWLWTNGYEDIRDTDSGRRLPAPEISLEGKTASSLSLSYKNDYPEFSESITLQGSPVEKGKKGYDLALTGLEPDKLYEGLATLTLTYEEAFYSKSFSFKTEPLTLTTQQPKIISLGNVIVAATSNLDDAEMNVGFEWRRTDWTDDFASNFGKAYLYKGTMEGYIRNLYIEKLWKYRPYYESNDGNRYYGNWVGIDPTNTSYFMPTVHTYSRINLLGNLAEIWGYVMRGTDNITMQGFIYWSISSTSSSRRNANGIPSDATKVLATGNVMSATLEDLDYDTEYCYMAFVTTSEGETFYGEPQTFKTSFDPDGIENVMASEEVTEVARYDIQGRMISKPQKGINIIRYSDGTTKKVIVKQ